MIGHRIKKLREAKGYKQEQLAGLLNISRQQLQRWEVGGVDPSGDWLVKLAKELETTTDYLLGASEDPYPDMTEGDLSTMEHKLVAAVRARDVLEAMKTITILAENGD